jgi:hypothetical protein
MTKLDISNNYKNTAGQGYAYMSEEFIRPIASMLKTNTSINELNVSSNWLNTEAAGILADGISDNGALTKLIFGGDEWHNGQKWTTLEPATLEVGMTEADFSNKGLQGAGAIVVAAWISHNDVGTLTSLHVGRNNISEKEMKEIMAVAMRMDSMQILCEVPFKDKALTELDVSGKDLGPEGALVVANYLEGNRALLSLNLADNYLCGIDEYGSGTFDASGNTHPLYHTP